MTRSASRPVSFRPRNFKQTTGAKWNKLCDVISVPTRGANGAASAASAIANSISFSHCAGVRGNGRFIEDSTRRSPPFVVIPIEYSALDHQAAHQKWVSELLG